MSSMSIVRGTLGVPEVADAGPAEGVDNGFGLERIVWVVGISRGWGCVGSVAVDDDGSDAAVEASVAVGVVPFEAGVGAGDGSLPRRILLPLTLPALPFVDTTLAFDALVDTAPPSASSSCRDFPSGESSTPLLAPLSFFDFLVDDAELEASTANESLLLREPNMLEKNDLGAIRTSVKMAGDVPRILR